MGRGYVIDHCVARLKQIAEHEAYQVYVTDALKAIADNTGRLVKEGFTMSKRFADFISDSPEGEVEPADAEKKGQEIKDHMKELLERLGRGNS